MIHEIIYFLKNLFSREKKDKGYCYITVGIPGSGKDTYINKNIDCNWTSRDKYRSKNPNKKLIFSAEKEYQITKKVNRDIKLFCSDKKNTSFAIINTSLKRIYRQDLISKVRSYNKNLKIKLLVFTTPLEICIKRREGQIKEEIIRNMYSSYEIPSILKEDFDEIEFICAK